MANQLKPQFFVTRHNGSMVPLIALDELPNTMVIRGVPRLLSVDDLSGMTCVGTFQARHRFHQVDIINKSPYTALSRYPPPAQDADRRPGTPLDNVLKRTQPEIRHPSDPSKADSSGAGKPKSLSSPESVPKSESDMPNVGEKVYCSYWMKRGECDFTQQGCQYKHEMPMDIKVLESIGLRDIPQWYRLKYGVASLKAVRGSDAALGGDGMRQKRFAIASESWRDNSKRLDASSAPTRSQGRRNRRARRESAGTGQESLISFPSSPCILPTERLGKQPAGKAPSVRVKHNTSQQTDRQKPISKDSGKQHEAKPSEQRAHAVNPDLLQLNAGEQLNVGEQFVPLVPEKSSSASEGSPVSSRRETALEEASGESSSESQAPRSEASGEESEGFSITNHGCPPRGINANTSVSRSRHSYNETPSNNHSGIPVIDPSLFRRSVARRNSNASDTTDIEIAIIRADAARRAEEDKAYAATVAAATAKNVSAEDNTQNQPKVESNQRGRARRKGRRSRANRTIDQRPAEKGTENQGSMQEK